MNHASQKTQLIDRFGRTVDYLRVSITDRCDFRCIYCMSEEMTFLSRAQILTLEEINFIAGTFVELGVNKIRVTGGEPLIRKGAMGLLTELGKLESLKELALSTNGSQLESMAASLKQANVKRINISLDTLDADKFKKITRTGELRSVLKGIQAARKVGFNQIKLNAVILKNRNHHEVVSLVQYAVDNEIDISFIEEMPLGIVNDHDRAEEYYSSDSIKSDLEQHFTLTPALDKTGGPSVYLKVAGSSSKVGFISPHSANFCGTCNRVRLTVEGRLLLCLGNEYSVDLKQVIRANPGDKEKLKQVIIDSMRIKPEKHEFNLKEQPIILRHMSVTGG